MSVIKRALSAGLKGLSKFFTKTIGSSLTSLLGSLTKILKKMSGGIFDFLLFIVDGVTFFFVVITCGLKLIGNFLFLHILEAQKARELASSLLDQRCSR